MKLPEYTLTNQQQTAETHTIQINLQLAADLDFFDGHFAQLPIMPAVAQLYIVKKITERYLRVNGEFVGLRQLKFKSPIAPNSDTELYIQHHINKDQVEFKYMAAGQLKSKGVFVFKQGTQA